MYCDGNVALPISTTFAPRVHSMVLPCSTFSSAHYHTTAGVSRCDNQQHHNSNGAAMTTNSLHLATATAGLL
jgi:hypothetical protein